MCEQYTIIYIFDFSISLALGQQLFYERSLKNPDCCRGTKKLIVIAIKFVTRLNGKKSVHILEHLSFILIKIIPNILLLESTFLVLCSALCK